MIGNSPILVSPPKPHHRRPGQRAIREEHRVIVHQSYFSTNPPSTTKPTSGPLVASSMNWPPDETRFMTTGRYGRISMAIVVFRFRFLNARFFCKTTFNPISRNCYTKIIASDLRRRFSENSFILIAGSWRIHASNNSSIATNSLRTTSGKLTCSIEPLKNESPKSTRAPCSAPTFSIPGHRRLFHPHNPKF